MEKVIKMVGSTTLLLIASHLLVFLIGRIYGQVESAIAFSKRINSIIDAMRKVENLAALKGEDISNLSTQEILNRTKKQMEIKND